jgi:mono/diheme cytochrome c family protein
MPAPDCHQLAARRIAFRRGLALAVLVLMTAGTARAAGAAAEAVAAFENEVRPLLVQKCVRCHGPKRHENGLRLDAREAVLRGGMGGPAVVPGDPEKSLLVAAIRRRGKLRMPPGGALRDGEVVALVRWVAQGAPWPQDAGAPHRTADGARGKRHWAFRPVTDPPVPDVHDAEWPLTPIDRFVLAQLEKEGLRPVGLADRRTLLRRVTFGLTGLPPTPEEIDAFIADHSADAYEKVVDRLLASPAYGERWGRHWLDVARYADTAGDGADYPVREAYKYRNYVIASFNADKPYDEFLREQVAGDILAREGAARGEPASKYAERVVATGFLAVGKRYGYNLNTQFQHLDFADTIDSVGRGVLGLTLGCARCHDHKYDPVSMADYYALYGILASTKFSFPGGEELKRPQQLVPLLPPGQVAAREKVRQDEVNRLDAEARRLAVLRGTALAFLHVPLPPAGAGQAVLGRRRAEAAAREVVEVAYAVSEGTPTSARIQKRGEPEHPGPEVPRRFLEVLGGDPLPPGCTGSGRRELAEWLTRPTNPLTARVMVNRIWQHHFGRGLVATPSDFGTRGDPPSHPELLDYLASRFMREGWSVKKLHRLILCSRVYRLAADDDPRARQADPENRLLWRHARQPLDAESIRDAMLAVAGRLDRSVLGPHPFPPVDTWGFTIHYPFHAVYDSNHRSVYLMVQRARRHPYLALFDAADPNLSVGARVPTTTPTQALYLMNAPFVHEQAEGFARRLLAAPGDDRARVRLAFALAHGREPADDEVRDALDFVAGYGGRLQSWAALGRVLLTANGFLYVD